MSTFSALYWECGQNVELEIKEDDKKEYALKKLKDLANRNK